jgi:hypothetical protein
LGAHVSKHKIGAHGGFIYEYFQSDRYVIYSFVMLGGTPVQVSLGSKAEGGQATKIDRHPVYASQDTG